MKNKPVAVILHCSATEDKHDHIGAEEIRQWHVNENGWSDIGYHYVIRRGAGLIEKGRPEEVVGAHCYGHNQNTLGVCLIGTRRPTMAQLDSLVKLYFMFRNKYGIPYNQWFGHNEFSNKECPGFHVNLVKTIFKYAETVQQLQREVKQHTVIT